MNEDTSITCCNLPFCDPSNPVKGTKAARKTILDHITQACGRFSPLKWRDGIEEDKITPDVYYKYACGWSTLSGGGVPYVTRAPM